MTGAPWTIRPAEPRDATALAEQFLALNRIEDSMVHDRWTEPEAGPAARDACWARVRETGGHALVAELGSQVIGHMFMWFLDSPVFIREELRRHAYVADLFVRAPHRGHGIGTALLAEAERLARAAGVPHLMVGVLAGNDGAEALYRREGFRPYAAEMIKPLGA